MNPSQQKPGAKPEDENPSQHLRQWVVQTRLQQLVIAEADAWRSFRKVGMAMTAGFLLLPIGLWVSGSSIVSHARPTGSPALRSIGFLLEGVGGMTVLISAVPFAVCFARWVEAIWQRRRFSFQ